MNPQIATGKLAVANGFHIEKPTRKLPLIEIQSRYGGAVKLKTISRQFRCRREQVKLIAHRISPNLFVQPSCVL